MNTIYPKKIMRSAMQVIPTGFRKVWKKWDLRLMVLLSLGLQLILMALGRRRKYDPNLVIRLIAWSAYLAADSVATFALGIISSSLTEIYDPDDNGHDPGVKSIDPNTELTAFWAPFLLLHLGGQDTMTAYSLEDNELWLRHLLGLSVQAIIVGYVYLMAWTGSRLSILSILMFIAGIVKCGERTWVLWSASSDKLKKSTFSRVRIRPSSSDKDLFLAEEQVKTSEGYIVRRSIVPEVQLPVDFSIFMDGKSISFKDKLLIAYRLLQNTTLSLFLETTTLSSRDRDGSKSVFRNLSFKDAFEVVAMELGLINDLFYTKALLLSTLWGLAFRLLTFSLNCSVLRLFTTTLDHRRNYSKIDISLTLLLLIVAIFLDIYSAVQVLLSDRFAIWLSRNTNFSTLQDPPSFPLSMLLSPRWSHKIGQLSLLSFSPSPPCRRVFEFMDIDRDLDKLWFVTRETLSDNLKQLIFRYLKQQALSDPKKTQDTSFNAVTIPEADARGEGEGEAINCFRNLFLREVPKFEEDIGRSILFWHIYTEVSYYLDQRAQDSTKQQFEAIARECNLIKQISDYMFYLLLVHPSMLSLEIDQDSIEDAVYKAVDELRRKRCRESLESLNLVELIRSAQVFGEDGRLDDALATARSGFYSERGLRIPPAAQKWNELGRTWLRIMGFAAKRCRGKEHGQQLRRGGELLTRMASHGSFWLDRPVSPTGPKYYQGHCLLAY